MSSCGVLVGIEHSSMDHYREISYLKDFLNVFKSCFYLFYIVYLLNICIFIGGYFANANIKTEK